MCWSASHFCSRSRRPLVASRWRPASAARRRGPDGCEQPIGQSWACTPGSSGERRPTVVVQAPKRGGRSEGRPHRHIFGSLMIDAMMTVPGPPLALTRPRSRSWAARLCRSAQVHGPPKWPPRPTVSMSSRSSAALTCRLRATRRAPRSVRPTMSSSGASDVRSSFAGCVIAFPFNRLCCFQRHRRRGSNSRARSRAARSVSTLPPNRLPPPAFRSCGTSPPAERPRNHARLMGRSRARRSVIARAPSHRNASFDDLGIGGARSSRPTAHLSSVGTGCPFSIASATIFVTGLGMRAPRFGEAHMAGIRRSEDPFVDHGGQA
jgi:hypothetical protein